MQCLICQNKTAGFLDDSLGVKFWHCKNCDLIFKDKKLFQDFESQKQRYDLHQNNPEDSGYRAYFQKFLDFVLPYINTPNLKALDYGCGESILLADMMLGSNIHTIAYDPIYHPLDLDKTAKFDIITSVEVFEHLTDVLQSFKEISSMLNQNGILAIRTEFHHGIDGMSKWYYPKDPTHILFFTTKTFLVLCDIYGFEYLGDNGKNMVLLRKL